MNASELAQALADKIHPPQTYERFKLDWRKWPEEEQTEMHTERRGPDDGASVSFIAADGRRSVRYATYREIAEAVLGILAEDQ